MSGATDSNCEGFSNCPGHQSKEPGEYPRRGGQWGREAQGDTLREGGTKEPTQGECTCEAWGHAAQGRLGSQTSQVSKQKHKNAPRGARRQGRAKTSVRDTKQGGDEVVVKRP